MKNFIQRGDTLTLTAPAAVEAGELVIVGEFASVAATSAALGADVECMLSGVFELPKAGEALEQGDAAYWDTEVTGDAGGGNNIHIGSIAADAALADTVVRVKLKG